MQRRIAVVSMLVLTLFASGLLMPNLTNAATFCDVSPGDPYYDAVMGLNARGIIFGYPNGCFGPNDFTMRAQMAAMIARTVGWTQEDHGNYFPDRGFIDDELWREVGTLNYYGVAHGYQDGTYRPTAYVLYAQVISFISRAMVMKGYWQAQADNPAIYPNVPADSGHRADIVTYVTYAGLLPGSTGTDQPWAAWDQPATRAWFALALWQVIGTPPSPPPPPTPSPEATQFKTQAVQLIEQTYPALQDIITYCPGAPEVMCQADFEYNRRTYLQNQDAMFDLGGTALPPQCADLWRSAMDGWAHGGDWLAIFDGGSSFSSGAAINAAINARSWLTATENLIVNQPGTCQ